MLACLVIYAEPAPSFLVRGVAISNLVSIQVGCRILSRTQCICNNQPRDPYQCARTIRCSQGSSCYCPHQDTIHVAVSQPASLRNNPSRSAEHTPSDFLESRPQQSKQTNLPFSHARILMNRITKLHTEHVSNRSSGSLAKMHQRNDIHF